jgi:hypothetical protein
MRRKATFTPVAAPLQDKNSDCRRVRRKKGTVHTVSEKLLLERFTAAAEERHLSQNTLTAYRRTWIKAIAWAAAEGLALETLPSERAASSVSGSISPWAPRCQALYTVSYVAGTHPDLLMLSNRGVLGEGSLLKRVTAAVEKPHLSRKRDLEYDRCFET